MVELIKDCNDILKWLLEEARLPPTHPLISKIKRIRATLQGIASSLGFVSRVNIIVK